MRMQMLAFALAVALAVPGVATAQEVAGGPWAQGAPGFLLRNRDRLQLTDDQVKKLEALQQQLEEKNRPLIEQMREIRGADSTLPPSRRERRAMTPEQRAEARARMEKLRPVMDEVRKNNQAAREEAQAILTAEQRKTASELFQKRRSELRERRRGKD